MFQACSGQSMVMRVSDLRLSTTVCLRPASSSRTASPPSAASHPSPQLQLLTVLSHLHRDTANIIFMRRIFLSFPPFKRGNDGERLRMGDRGHDHEGRGDQLGHAWAGHVYWARGSARGSSPMGGLEVEFSLLHITLFLINTRNLEEQTTMKTRFKRQ